MMDGTAAPAQAAEGPEDQWARVEIFGHRRHYGRISEVERFGAKMLKIEVPLEGQDTFATFYYGGGSIFSLTLMDEPSARAWAIYAAKRDYAPLSLMPPGHDVEPAEDFGEEENAGEFEG